MVVGSASALASAKEWVLEREWESERAESG